MSNVFWIHFVYNGDLIGGRVDGTTAELYWNDKMVGERPLRREYTAAEFQNLHPLDIQNAVFKVAGFEAFQIQGLTIQDGDLDWQELLVQRRG